MLRRSSKSRERLFDDPFLFSLGTFELVNTEAIPAKVYMWFYPLLRSGKEIPVTLQI